MLLFIAYLPTAYNFRNFYKIPRIEIFITMASARIPDSDMSQLLLFLKTLTIKVAQIVVQSRKGKKVTAEMNAEAATQHPSSACQLFNLSIPDDPDVTTNTNNVINGELIEALSKVVTIEILMDAKEPTLVPMEYWTVRLLPSSDPNMTCLTTIYNRMCTMLKTTLTISRITYAYKISRKQNTEPCLFTHRIFCGSPDPDELGENNKHVRVSQLCTPVGTLVIDVMYRFKSILLQENKLQVSIQSEAENEMPIKSDHFSSENKKSKVDLSKPLRPGAFVDTNKLKELHETLREQLPPSPPLLWLIDTNEHKEKRTTSQCVDIAKPGISDMTSHSAPTMSTTLKTIPKTKEGENKYNSLMSFTFAHGNPMSELAKFYKDCLNAKSDSEEWTDLLGDVSVSTDSETLSRQIKMYEDAVPEFDNMVASMFSNDSNKSK